MTLTLEKIVSNYTVFLPTQSSERGRKSNGHLFTPLLKCCLYTTREGSTAARSKGGKITCEIKLIWKRKVQLSPTRLAQTGSNQKIIKTPPQNIYFINSFTNVCAWNSAPLGHSITSEHLPWRDCFVEHVKKPLSISQVNLVSNILT